MSRKNNTLVVFSQAFVPDPISTGQHMADVAEEMAARGWDVKVFSSRRGLDNPRLKFLRKETRKGYFVRRFSFSSFGKRSVGLRLFAGCLFNAQCIISALFIKDLKGVLVCTSPPIAPLAALIVSKLKGAPILFWVHDVNPDQMIALGKTRDGSLASRAFNGMIRSTLKNARAVIALDDFMAARLNSKWNVSEKMSIYPPWPHDSHMKPVDHVDNTFRRDRGWHDKFVVMYSGNHAVSNPITTILQAAKELSHEKNILFAFVGGGVGKSEVESFITENPEANVVSLPYQPLENLSFSLSSADIHVVSIGSDLVGIVHPCKIYSALAVERPLLFLGPRPCHGTPLIDKFQLGWQVEHGDVEGAKKAILEAQKMSPESRKDMGARGGKIREEVFSQKILCGQLCDAMEAGLKSE